MARKKKVVKKPVAGTANNIGYTGNITVTLKNGNKVVSTHHYKNNGKLNLWYFLSATLAGQYAEAELYRPTRIVLYWCKDEAVPTEDPIAGVDLTNTNSFVRLTGEISANRATEVLPVKSGGTTVNWTATIHFLVPPAHFSKIKDAWINTAVLYGKTEPTSITTNNKNNYSAIYFFTKQDEVSGEIKWIGDDDKIIVNDIKENYNLIIDWQMSFDNK